MTFLSPDNRKYDLIIGDHTEYFYESSIKEARKIKMQVSAPGIFQVAENAEEIKFENLQEYDAALIPRLPKLRVVFISCADSMTNNILIRNPQITALNIHDAPKFAGRGIADELSLRKLSISRAGDCNNIIRNSPYLVSLHCDIDGYLQNAAFLISAKLRKLYLRHCSRLTGDLLKFCPNLRELHLVNIPDMGEIRNLHKLESLTILCNNYKNAGITYETLANLGNLRKLTMTTFSGGRHITITAISELRDVDFSERINIKLNCDLDN